MSRQLFIQFKRHFLFLKLFIALCQSPAVRFASVASGSGSQALRMGTTKYARRKGLASAGAGFWEHPSYHPTNLN